MKETLLQTLSSSAYKILRSLIRVMIRNGVSCGTFEELVRKAYVDEAFAQGVNSNKKMTISSVSAQTGLSRKEVKRLKELENFLSAGSQEKFNRATRVLSGWIHSSEFIDESGNPKELSLGEETPSFNELVKQHSGDITPKAMLELLSKANCIRVQDNKAIFVSASYLPGNDSAEIAKILGNDTYELIHTIGHNMGEDGEHKRFQRKVSTTKLNKSDLNAFKEISAKHSQELLERLDEWLIQHETENESDGIYVSLGIYYYQESQSEESNHD